jgi:hypothetical protein
LTFTEHPANWSKIACKHSKFTNIGLCHFLTP